LANVAFFILLGRLAGASEAGTFSLAIAYLILFTAAMSGLDDLVVRQVSREPGEAFRYLVSFSIVCLGLSILSYPILSYLLSIFSYAETTASMVLVLSLSLVPENLAYVAQAVLLGLGNYGAPAAVLSLSSAVRLVGGALVLLLGGELQCVAWVWFLGSLMSAAALLVIALWKTGWPRLRSFEWDPVAKDWRTALTFLSITTLMTLEGQADVLLLSAFHDESEVGWYGAATTIAFSLSLFSQAYQFAVYPMMARYALHAPEKLTEIHRRSVLYLGAAVFPMVVGIALLSPQIVRLIFGSGFDPSIGALRVLIGTMIFIFLFVPDCRVLLVRNRQGWVWLSVAGSVTVNVLLNLLLDPLWGATGAAIARVSSSAFLFLTVHWLAVRTLAHPDPLRLLLRPALATVAMSVVVWLTRDWPLLATVPGGALVYGGVLLCLEGTLRADAALAFWTTRRSPVLVAPVLGGVSGEICPDNTPSETRAERLWPNVTLSR
jgi:O-antigen/teichoic acid export membrane protein